jgi:hypothetical protein
MLKRYSVSGTSCIDVIDRLGSISIINRTTLFHKTAQMEAFDQNVE